MATPKVSITFDADLSELKKATKSAEGDVDSFGSRVGDMGKKVAAAFAIAAAAAAAYAIKIGIDGVKSAIEDEQAQFKLANALKTATGATDAQIKATEAYISKMQLATGVSDNDLRNSMQRLSVSTKDVNKSQDLLNLALDVSKGTGKDLASVTEALAKSYEGQDGKLAKLGIGLSQADLKTMNFTETTKALSNLYGGAAAQNAETFQGKIDRLKQAFDEAKETLGNALLPILQKLIDFVVLTILPVFKRLTDGLGGGEGFMGAIMNVVDVIKSYATPIFEAMIKVFEKVRDVIVKNKDNFADFFDVIKAAAPVLGNILGGVITVLGTIATTVLDIFAKVLGALKPILNTAIDGINLVIRGLNLINPGKDIPYVGKIGESGSGSNFTYNSGNPLAGQTTTPTVSTTPTVPTTQTTPTTTGSKTTSGSGVVVAMPPIIPTDYTPFGQAGGNGSGYIGTPFGQAVSITVNQGIVGDPESAARAVIGIINDSYYRGTGGAGNYAGF
jgi:hypothetical protein